MNYVQDTKGIFHFISTANLQGVKVFPAVLVGTDSVDLTTCPMWVSTSAFSATTSNTRPLFSPVACTQISRSLLVSRGAESNLLTTLTIPATINANGVTKVDDFAGDDACLGWILGPHGASDRH